MTLAAFASRRRLAGYSLVEMAVALAVTTVIGLAVVSFTNLWRAPGSGNPSDPLNAAARRLLNAQALVEGFALRQNRLPCPDSTGTGLEDCAATIGRLPWLTLRTSPADGRLRYAIYRGAGADLGQAASTYQPGLPVAVAPVINGLDLCWKLRAAAQSPAGLAVDGMSAAYALADPGANGAFDAANAAAGNNFESPLRPVAGVYDDQVALVGPYELAGRMGCAVRLAQVQAAARNAFAASDIERVYAQFADLRSFAHLTRQQDTAFAATSLAIASLKMAISIGIAATSVSVAANSVGLGVGVVLGAGAEIGLSAAALAAGIGLVAVAAVAEQKAYAQKLAATDQYTQTVTQKARALAQALTQDSRGLKP